MIQIRTTMAERTQTPDAKSLPCWIHFLSRHFCPAGQPGEGKREAKIPRVACLRAWTPISRCITIVDHRQSAIYAELMNSVSALSRATLQDLPEAVRWLTSDLECVDCNRGWSCALALCLALNNRLFRNFW